MGLDLFFPPQLINSMKVSYDFSSWRLDSHTRILLLTIFDCVSVTAATEVDPANVSAVRDAQGGRLHGQVFWDPQRFQQLRRRGFPLRARGEYRHCDPDRIPPLLTWIFTKHLTVLTCQQQGWSLSVELVIGGRGIRQRTQKNSAVSTHITIIFKFVDCFLYHWNYKQHKQLGEL